MKRFQVYVPVLFGESWVEIEAQSVNDVVKQLGPLLEDAFELGCEPVIEVKEVGLNGTVAQDVP